MAIWGYLLSVCFCEVFPQWVWLCWLAIFSQGGSMLWWLGPTLGIMVRWQWWWEIYCFVNYHHLVNWTLLEARKKKSFYIILTSADFGQPRQVRLGSVYYLYPYWPIVMARHRHHQSRMTRVWNILVLVVWCKEVLGFWLHGKERFCWFWLRGEERLCWFWLLHPACWWHPKACN